MKVAILCACADPGRDGVGDYSARLGTALLAMGHQVLLIAERDPGVSDGLIVNTERDGIPVLRLSSRLPAEQRGRSLAAALDAFAADWVLLQFVCWGMADHGVLEPRPTAFINALAGRRVAIYCHELWLGLERGAGPRHRVWGWRQRRSILRFFARLRPALLMTSNVAYRGVLERCGWSARVIPLFSNIPLDREGRGRFLSLLEQQAGQPLWKSRDEVVMVAVFGSIYPEWQPQAALEWIGREARVRDRRVLLVIAGRSSARGEALVTQLARATGASMTIQVLGEVSPPIVSGLLQEADIGLPSSDWLLLGKSGVAAAMTAHGLPMLVVRSAVSFRDLPDLAVTHAPSIFRFDADAPPDFDRLLARGPAAETLPEIARQLLGAFEDAH